MVDERKTSSTEIAKRLRAAELDLDAARRLLADPPNILAATHLQQAAEKILGAVRLSRGLLVTKDHDLVLLIDGRAGGGEPQALPVGDPWRERFRPYEDLSVYATTFRYSLKPAPKIDDWFGTCPTCVRRVSWPTFMGRSEFRSGPCSFWMSGRCCSGL